MDRASPFCFISFVAAWRQAGCRRDRQIARSQDKQMEEHIEVEGRILTVLAGTMFRVELDNIVKGASGQAVQCLNIMGGFAETAGLV